MYWIKDGQIYHGGGIVLNGVWYSNPTPEQFIAAGWERYTPPPVPPAPKKYSKLKVIRALGSGWEAKKLMIEQAGLWDQFVAAAWLAEDDPAFAPIYASLSDEEREILDTECLYDE